LPEILKDQRKIHQQTAESSPKNTERPEKSSQESSSTNHQKIGRESSANFKRSLKVYKVY
ncbi:3143_t:CDS:1, partial [Scutellospora calospora]